MFISLVLFLSVSSVYSATLLLDDVTLNGDSVINKWFVAESVDGLLFSGRKLTVTTSIFNSNATLQLKNTGGIIADVDTRSPQTVSISTSSGWTMTFSVDLTRLQPGLLSSIDGANPQLTFAHSSIASTSTDKISVRVALIQECPEQETNVTLLTASLVSTWIAVVEGFILLAMLVAHCLKKRPDSPEPRQPQRQADHNKVPSVSELLASRPPPPAYA